MAELPRILARPNLADYQLPRAHVNQTALEGLHTFAQAFAGMAERQKPIETAETVADYNIKVNDLKNEVMSDPDPLTWRDNFTTKERQLREEVLGGLADAQTKQAVGSQIAKLYDNNIIDISTNAIKASH